MSSVVLHHTENHLESLSHSECVMECLFRQETIDPTRLVSNMVAVSKIAQAVYNERRFEDVPSLADSLIDVGCKNEEVLIHCRPEGTHGALLLGA